MHDEQRKYYEGQNRRLTLEGVKSSVWKETLENTKQSFVIFLGHVFNPKRPRAYKFSLCKIFKIYLWKSVACPTEDFPQFQVSLLSYLSTKKTWHLALFLKVTENMCIPPVFFIEFCRCTDHILFSHP